MFMVAYENSEKGIAYYDESGSPWWCYDKTAHGTRYESRETAEARAELLRSQMPRSGPIKVVSA
jgi:hypothetical protein